MKKFNLKEHNAKVFESSLWGSVWGIGSLIAGVTTVISNVLNLKRMNR